MSEVLNLVLLLALLMYIFAIMGYYFFGSLEYARTGISTGDWDSLGSGCMSLFVYVTADGWSDLQEKLDEDGYVGSKIFTVAFLLVGHFIFINIFIGVVIRNIEQAAQDEAAWQKERRATSYLAKKRAAIAEQERFLTFALEQRDEGEAGERRNGKAKEEEDGEKGLVVLPRSIIAHPMWGSTYLLLVQRQRAAMTRRMALHRVVAAHLNAAVSAQRRHHGLGREELQRVIVQEIQQRG